MQKKLAYYFNQVQKGVDKSREFNAKPEVGQRLIECRPVFG